MNRAIVASVCLLALAIAVVGYYALPRTAAEDAAVASVNGEPVAMATLERAMRGQRAAVIEYFRKKGLATVDKRFWHTRFGGEVPIDVLKNRALQAVVKERVELALAKSVGLIADTSDEDLMREKAEENERRAKAVRNGEPIYGPVKLDTGMFMAYYFSNLTIWLKDKLAQTKLAATDEQLRSYYDSIKELRFKREDTLDFALVSVSYLGEDGSGASGKKRQAQEALTAIRERIVRDEDLDAAVADIRKEYPDLEAVVARRTFSPGNARTYARYEPALFQALTSQPADRPVSEAIDESSNGSLAVFRVLDRREGGYDRFEDRAENVRNLYIDQAFEAYVDALVREADVQIDEERYAKATIE